MVFLGAESGLTMPRRGVSSMGETPASQNAIVEIFIRNKILERIKKRFNGMDKVSEDEKNIDQHV